MLLLSNAGADDRVVWSGSGAYRTVGKREIQTGELRRQLGAMLHQMSRDRADAYDAYVDALDSMQAGDRAAAATHLLRAGGISEAASLLEQARAWYGVALEVAGTVRTRGPEIQALLALGRVTMRLGRFQDAGRHFQRALALAESEHDHEGTADACTGLGNIALEQVPGAHGARAWFDRGLASAREVGSERRMGELHLKLGDAACRAGEWTLASASLRQARELFQQLSDSSGVARVLALQAALSAAVGDQGDAMASWREAIACVLGGDPDQALEVSLRIDFAKLLLESGRFVEANEELRLAEQQAIARSLIHDLIHIYTLMGSAHGRQGDEVGFVFFEQAIELMRLLDHSQLDEAQVCLEYGLFESRVDRPEESRAYLERAREIFESVGASGGLARVVAELDRVSA